MGIETVTMDMTGVGQGFQDDIRRTIGRGYSGFNFSDWKSVEEMMGNMNYALHNDLVSLPNDEKMEEQLGAIVKQQSYEGSRVRFSGKDHAPEGRDDLAIATVMGAFPPNFKGDDGKSLYEGEKHNSGDAVKTGANSDDLTGEKYTGLKISESADSRGYSLSNGRSNTTYSTRHTRRSTSRRRKQF
jgi:hypothetical protein